MSKSSEAVKRWRATTKSRMVDAMGGKCQCCGYSISNNSLAFHHIDPTQKDIGFGETRANPKNWEITVSELRKCILVCHNCHGEIHAGIRELPEEYNTFDETYSSYKKTFEQLLDNCPVCNNKKYENLKFCSYKCAAKNNRKVDWDNVDLIELLKNNTISELEDLLGVSNAAIYKRRDKILGKK
jgi:hypothetical protein